MLLKVLMQTFLIGLHFTKQLPASYYIVYLFVFTCRQVAKTEVNSHSAPPQVKKYLCEDNSIMQIPQQFIVNTRAHFFETPSITAEVTLLDD